MYGRLCSNPSRRGPARGFLEAARSHRSTRSPRRSAVPQIRISAIVNGKRAITPDTALRLARYFGTSAEFWVGMQATYDLEMARDRIGAKIRARVHPRAA